MVFYGEIHKSHINPMDFPMFFSAFSPFFLGVRGELYGFGPRFWRPRRNTGALDILDRAGRIGCHNYYGTIRWNGPFLKILRNRRVGFWHVLTAQIHLQISMNLNDMGRYVAGISWSGNFSGANMGMWPTIIGTWAGYSHWILLTHRIHGAGIYANIWGILMVNVTIYSIHGSYGLCHWTKKHDITNEVQSLANFCKRWDLLR